MNEDEIKNLRHSFTNPYREDLPRPVKNQFGHTILNSDNSNINIESVEVEVDEFGEVKAQAKQSLIDSPNMINLINKMMDTSSEDEVEVANVPINIYTELISELDEMDGTAKLKPLNSPKQTYNDSKSCINKSCSYSLPKDANFCLKCGTAQLSKFCVECGFNFKAEEKFCPDCGTKR